MAADKHTIKITDKDGNQSEVTLPGFALDSTQEKLLKSMQLLGKADDKMLAALEKLLESTKDAVKSGKKSDKDQIDAIEDLQNAVEATGEKQKNALKDFRTNFADRIGGDMRNVFTGAGNILTAAITSVTVGLTAGAGFLFKSFMDTSNAFRELAKSGLGGQGTGAEATNAIRSLAQLGMSSQEAAGFITGFGRSAALLGKANFAKFVSGIANSGSFAADLGLTLSEAAEYAAEELDIRQRTFAGQMQLNEFNRQSIIDAIEQTQRFAGVMGRSMKDINDSKKQFLDSNANINSLMLRLGDKERARVQEQINRYLGAAAALGGDYERLMQGLLNAAAKTVPLQDSNLQAIASLGPAGNRLRHVVMRMSKDLNAGNFSNVEGYVNELTNGMRHGGKEFNIQLSNLANNGNEFAAMLINAASLGEQGGKKLAEAFKKSASDLMDPMVKLSANMQNTLDRLNGAFKNVGLGILSNFSGPLNQFIDELNRGQYDLSKLNDEQKSSIKTHMTEWEKSEKARIDGLTGAAKAEAEQSLDRRRMLEQEAQYEKAGLEKNRTVTSALTDGLNKIVDAFMNAFFPNLGQSGDKMGDFVQRVVTAIDEFATDVSDFLKNLKGDTASAKIQDAMKKLFEKAVPIISHVLTETTKALLTALWENPMVLATLVAGIAGLFAIQAATTALVAGIGSMFAAGATAFASSTLLTTAITTITTALSGAGLSVALAIESVAAKIAASNIPGGGMLAKASRFLLPLAAGGLVAGGLGYAGNKGADYLEEKGVVDKQGGAWTKVLADTAAGAAGGATVGAIGGLGAMSWLTAPTGALIGGAGGLAYGLYDQWSNLWGGNDEETAQVAEEAKSQLNQQMQEELMKQQGLALAMATNPEHLAAVQKAITDLMPILKGMNDLKFEGFAAGMTVLKDSLDSFFKSLQSVKIIFVDNVIKRLERLYTVLSKLNNEGKDLPKTEDALKDFGKRIEKMPTDSIEKLAISFDAFAKALSSFINLTTTTNIERGLDWLLGKEDTSGSIIETVNKFADGVNTDKLLKAAQAVQAYNTAVSGYASTVQPKATETNNPKVTATDVNKAPNTPPKHPGSGTDDKMLTELQKISASMLTMQQDIAKIKAATPGAGAKPKGT